MRRLLLLITSLAMIALSTQAFAKTLKIATLSPDGSAWMISMKKAAKAIAEQTDNRVKVRFYPGGVMGNDASVMKKIRIGQLHGAALSGGALSDKAPDTQIYNLPLLFNNFEEIDYVRSKLDGDLEAQYLKAGFKTFGFAEGGFAYVMSKQPIADVSDLKQNKVWVPNNDPASESAAQTFEFSPIPLSLGDVLAGLQTGLINTISSSPIAAIALQWHTQVTHITDLPLLYFYGMLALDNKVFSKLKPEDQKVVEAEMRKAFAEIDKQNRKDNESAFAALQAQGIKLVKLSPEQVKGWEHKSTSSINEFLNKGGISQEAYQKIQTLLTDYRQQNAQ